MNAYLFLYIHKVAGTAIGMSLSIIWSDLVAIISLTNGCELFKLNLEIYIFDQGDASVGT